MGDEDLGRLSDRIASLRGEHSDEGLELEDLDADPFQQFGGWLADALKAHPDWPNAMTLATADANGRPSARTVLLKGVDHEGFVFFTNHESRKGRELAENPAAALVFYWPGLERQVSVRGTVERVSRDESQVYFDSRPVRSRLGAWASEQSRPLSDRSTLEAEVERLAAGFKDDIPLPDHWGGYRLVPDAFEFWKSRSNRLHDRFLYSKSSEGWEICRLSP